MKKILAIQGSDLKKINIKTDTTLLLASEAQKRGYKIYYFEPEKISFLNGKIIASCKHIQINDKKKKVYTLIKTINFDLSKCKIILIRNDPPFENQYLYTTFLLSHISKKVKNALEMVELQDFGNRMPLQLSGGQQQRVALARALVFEPRLVLMDEPLGALDKNLREQMQYEIKHIHEKIGITVVYVTHDQSEALTMSNRIAVFNDGKIQQISSPDVLYEKPTSAFVAQFIGENNQLKGKVESLDGNNCVVVTETGEKIHALKVNVNNVGDKSLISLRPERVAINSSEKFENNFDAKVKELIYLGDHIRTRLEICGNDQFIVKVPNSYASGNLKEGEIAKLSWKSADSRALEA